ncbi:hypothetical protein [Marimonas arenosa]|uniref:Uncharacterized protein n=1 Tax=Marimonas arenosa TaxID=1795305 RepID=A0AAE4B4S1_9RHOB|nr:hypothetical protein [Marimonas arenosa]MDQ2090530.1 hypothetical protein [Marimonas arenosa]
MSKAIQAAMSQEQFPESARVRPPAPEAEVRMSPTEKIGSRWRVREDALWNPFEVISNMLWIVFGFGFFMGRSHYAFVAELFAPVFVLGFAVLLGQATLRRRAGEAGVMVVMRRRLGLG